jgi:alpha-galactosidase
MFCAVIQVVLVGLAAANDNGLAKLPPMGWRSWNLFGANVNQKLIEGIMDGMVKRSRLVDGKKTSLCDLGYCDVGLDDNWQDCSAAAATGNNYHDTDGNPVVNLNLFPDMKAMTDYAHKLGLTAGWYGNNCICMDQNSSDRKYYEGDVKAFRAFGFDAWKLDGCGVQNDLQLFDDLLKADGGKPVMVENCHWGSKVPFEPTRTWCPWNFYRTSYDIRASYSSVIGNLNSVTKFSSRNLSYPGCWAYPDMLEVGCKHGPGGPGDPGLTMAEARTHFASWAIVSSPLTLSHDVNNDTIMDRIWPIISNKEVIGVSQSYAGFSGGPFKSSSNMIQLDAINHAAIEKGMSEAEITALGPHLAPVFQYLYKPMEANGAKVAVMLINHGNATADLKLDFADVPGLACSTCNVRDIWAHEDLGAMKGSYTAKAVASHDSALLIITSAATEELIFM